MAFSRLSDLAQAMGDEIVTLYVGPERKRYVVHKALLTKESDYFDKALNGSFKEAEEQSIDLPEESSAAVNLLVGWLYQDRIPVVGSAAGTFVTHSDETAERLHTLFQSNNLFGGFQSTGLFGAPSRFPGQVEMQNTVYFEQNEGTGRVPYHAAVEPTAANAGFMGGQANQWYDSYDNISAQQEYRPWSPEELRLADYHRGRTDSSKSITTSQTTSTGSSSRQSTTTSQTMSSFTTSNATFFDSKRIAGIPVIPSLQDLSIQEENHQLAVLELCLLAETLCWPSLFNRAMSAYISGEANLSHRPILTSHITLVYERAHDTSPCRTYISDAVVFHIRNLNTHDQYMELMVEYPSFLKDFLQSIAATAKAGIEAPEAMRNPNRMERCVYHVHAEGEKCEKDTEMWPAIKREPVRGFGQTDHKQTRSLFASREQNGDPDASPRRSSPSRGHGRYDEDD